MRFGLVLALLAAGLLAGPAHAGVMLAPVSATTTFSSVNPSYPLANMFNQSGLSPGYTTGVTDFATLTAAASHYAGDFSLYNWASPSRERTGTITFALGQLTTIDSFALWNGNQDFGIRDFTLVASADSSFTTTTTLGAFTATRVADFNFSTAEVFSFAPTSAAYVRLSINSVQGTSPSRTYIGEVAFSQVGATAVPEPGTLALAAAGVVGLAGWRWRRRRA